MRPATAALRLALVLGCAVATASPLRAHENALVHRGLGHWSVDILGNPFYTATYRTEIGNGCDQEDVPATRSLGHFYNPETNSAPWFALGSGPATTNSQTQYNAAISDYLANNLVGTDAAFHRMGRALHFIQDMTSPAHTHDDDHALGDDFEGWGPANFPAMNFSTVVPKFASPPTAAGFVAEIGRLIYDQTVYQAVLHESTVAQPASVLKQMFPSLHFESGGFFVDDHFEIDRIGDWGCDLLCADDWWMPDELTSSDNGGPGGSTRYTGAAYIENTGGDGGPVVPVVFGGQPNTANESLLQLYGRLFYPEAIAYGAGLLQVFADAVGAPPLPTATGTVTATPSVTLTPPPTLTRTATHSATATGTVTDTATPLPTATPPPTLTPTATPPPTATPSATRTASATATPTPSATGTVTATPSATPVATRSATASGTATATATPTFTATPLCGATPRTGCTAPTVAKKSKLLFRDGSLDSLVWRWSKGSIAANELGDPLTTTDYALCVYDHNAGVPTLVHVASVASASVCGGEPCWRATGRGFRFKNRDGNASGVQKVVVKHGVTGNAKLLVKAKGPSLTLPTSPGGGLFFAQDPTVVAQLVNGTGACWEATYGVPASRNQLNGFSDKSD